jgi:hypothetical protein
MCPKWKRQNQNGHIESLDVPKMVASEAKSRMDTNDQPRLANFIALSVFAK